MEAKTSEKLADDEKRWSKAIRGVLAAVLMTMPFLVILLGGRNIGAPGMWIQTAVAGLRQGKYLCCLRTRFTSNTIYSLSSGYLCV
jgi:xyloglucan fucosyltransferase